ncbi:hypothetical protein QBC32DRAFT_395282 [Pseudoneurospora amorphoporcata]|uniref:Uncharacterized protein n=1 Tax=Pseudoneurospora amorphoporcata TaxID=241081 RepID=A0AAN6P0X5_9PEZI|nr:hypothetical protein QBC32DRAFT_395282 [Pseudoneurospora amorphoporcata]
MPNLFKRLSHRRHSEEDRNQHSENEGERRSSDPHPSRARLPSLSSWRLPGSSNGTSVSSRTYSTLDPQTVTTSNAIRSPTSVPCHRSPSPRSDLFGLHVLHQPESHTHDLIFVHGLGGHPQLTWSKNHNVDLFWPELWLPEDPDVGRARIFTYGYDAKYLGGNKNTNSITNFAKDLLFQMRCGKDKNGQDLDIGQNPLTFVVHSMGGLVVKKAYLMGFHDKAYKDIIAVVSAIIFLSTPHRGTNLADTLENLLQYSFQAKKDFISDLKKNSPAIDEINESFRHVAPKLSIYSFYETLETTIGPKKVMILEKDSSVMGYSDEVSIPLTADHHDVCKYSSREDHNYKSVVSAIRKLVKLFRSKTTNSGYTFANVQELFQVTITSDSDYAGLRTDWARGTCQWLLEMPDVVTWLGHGPSAGPHVLWYTAPPGSGKSMLSAFMIDHLQNSHQLCHFFIFRHSVIDKRSIFSCLRTLAFQLARDVPSFRDSLLHSSAENLGLRSSDPRVLWQKVFKNILLKQTLDSTLYWIIDGIDESDSAKDFLELLKSLATETPLPLNIMVLSRITNNISLEFDRLSQVIPVTRVNMIGDERSRHDIELFVTTEMRHMGGSAMFKESLAHRIVTRASGNFLWAKLVLEEISQCDTEDDIEEALAAIPDAMFELYERMERNLTSSTKKSKTPLIRKILEWVICAQRPLSVMELTAALSPERFLDLRKTIRETCGQFIQVDDTGSISILHHTAREYLTQSRQSELFVDTKNAHQKLLSRCLQTLQEEPLRWRLVQNDGVLQSTEPFVFYAALNWSYHLRHSKLTAPETLDDVLVFLKNPGVLSWIHVLALLQKLEVMIKTSKVLATFVSILRKQNESKNPMQHRLLDIDLLHEWSVDLLKILGKFGRSLLSQPELAYEVIPALCPPLTAVHKQFHNPKLSRMRVLGQADKGWNDNLGRLALPNRAQGSVIACASRYIAVLSSDRRVYVWNSKSFTEIAVISLDEHTTAIALSENGEKLATYGRRRTRIWSLPSGALLSTTNTPEDTRAKCLVFGDKDQKLLVAGDDNLIRHIECGNFGSGWEVLSSAPLKDTGVEGAIVTSPRFAAFSPNRTHVAVSYRSAPLAVWRLYDGRCVGICMRTSPAATDVNLSRPAKSWNSVDRFVWNPVTGHIVGVYKNGCVFKWHPLMGDPVEVQKAADEIAISPDGKLFATSTSKGTIYIWSFHHFTVLYELSSTEVVTQLMFSPDSRRFYDLRWGSVNAWEPNILTRFLDHDEQYTSDSNSEDTSSTMFDKVSLKLNSRFTPVTTFAPSRDGKVYCVGYKNGQVLMFNRGDRDGIEIASPDDYAQVVDIRWGQDGRNIAIVDADSTVHVRSIDSGSIVFASAPRNLPVELDTFKAHDILFNPDSRLILVSTDEKAYVCSITDNALQASIKLENGSDCKWICHPRRSDTVLRVGPNYCWVHDWETLELLSTLIYLQDDYSEDSRFPTPIRDIPTSSRAQLTSKVVNAFLAQSEEHILVHVRDEGDRVRRDDVILIAVDALEGMSISSRRQLVRVQHVHQDVVSQMSSLLGVLPGRRFVILDHDLWLRVYALDSVFHADDLVMSRFNQPYQIPRDWAGNICGVSHCQLTKEFTVFWPKDDQVVLIQYDLDGTGLS